MKYPKHEMITASGRDINGNQWHQSEINLYNSYSEKLNQYAGRKVAKGSLLAQEVEFYLNQRFSLTLHFIENAKQPGVTT